MAIDAFGLVILAAALHATWNALMKSSGDRLVSAWAIIAAGGVVSLPILIVLGLPERNVWAILVGSAAVHVVYMLFLTQAYERADLAVAYPIARGSAPLLVTAAGVVLLDDTVSALGLAGVVMICGGLGLLVLGRELRSVQWAIGTGVMIATYTLIDGYAVRTGGESLRYIAGLFVVHALLFTVVVVGRRGWPTMRIRLRTEPGRLLMGGAAGAAAYLLVMIAARTEALGLVSGLRETSGLFGLLIGWRILREDITVPQVIAVLLAVGGAIAIALG